MNIRKIAKIAECSPATISRVLSGNHGNVPISPKTRDKILKICAEHKYEPNIHASRMFSKRTGLIGLVSSETRVEDDNLSKFISGVNKKLNESGERLILLLQDDKFISTKEYLTLFRRRELDALIIWGAFGDETWLAELSQKKYPFIMASNKIGDYPSVVCDENAGMASVVDECLKRGAKSFLHITGGDMEVSQRRKNGFLLAVGDYKYRIIDSDFSLASGIKIAKQLIDNLPDAIVCVNDQTAIGIITGLKKEGIVIPKDVIVTGADNINMSQYLDPSITSYDSQATKCGEECVIMLNEFLKSDKPLTTKLIPPEIHIRDSTKN